MSAHPSQISAAADSDRDATWIDLEPGVREKVVGTGLFAYTAAVRFDPAEGWDAEKAAAWLEGYRGFWQRNLESLKTYLEEDT